ncbi:ATP-grasp domain-containing protein [Cohnella thailandensis]|uniref:ATP-grasp domain-containing protein n=1 Tax=Cohnella thailandensis TaxID=557557 RepID=A0A841SSG8_9BACL|nr:ATP-grasp domain-containing protein [Cohnella thailandensis]MBB6632567.1 ATP-grasp domain-containing protein [Cohnella thailandensis]MBP1971861.1 carbamoyl-phosphate synthase large subunit [Cohnella thailandensis]
MGKLLLTAIGRRVQLARHFISYGWDLEGSDLRADECAAQGLVKMIHEVPRYNEEGYYDRLMEICLMREIGFLVPLFEPELIQLSKLKKRFNDSGTLVFVSNEDSLRICLNKYNLACFFKENGILTPDTLNNERNIDSLSKWVVKPCTGMGGKQVFIATHEEVGFYSNKVSNPIFQRYIDGQEYSIDVFVAEDGQVLSVVPRLRLEVRAGEVSKSITVIDEEVTSLTLELLSKLKLFGPATIQGIKEEGTGRFYFIEVNPRFGGGVPLTIEAGIPYAKFLKADYRQEPNTLYPYRAGLKMLRYDEAIFVGS